MIPSRPLRVLLIAAAVAASLAACQRAEKKEARSLSSGRAAALRVVGQGLLRIDRELDRMAEFRSALAVEHRVRLREMRRRIDELLDEGG